MTDPREPGVIVRQLIRLFPDEAARAAAGFVATYATMVVVFGTLLSGLAGVVGPA